MQDQSLFTVSALKDTSMQTLHNTFLRAFSDYPISISLCFAQFQNLLMRRGFSSEMSAGAFHKPSQELAGFVLNGVRCWQGKTTAYDIGTGVIPAYRRQGLTKQMLSLTRQMLVENGVEQYLLEVLQENTAAVALYQAQGFAVSREFSCWTLEKHPLYFHPPAAEMRKNIAIDKDMWMLLQSFWDFAPSWQNSIDSAIAGRKNLYNTVAYIEDEIAGYGIIDQESGEVLQIAVRKDHRRIGIATGIIFTLQELVQTEGLRLINVDDACKEMNLFLSHLGARLNTKQYEMMLSFT